MSPIVWFAIGLPIGVAMGMAVMAMLHAQRGCKNDTELLTAVEEYGWQIGYIEGRFAVLGGTPQRVIGESGEDLREVIERALELVEAGVAGAKGVKDATRN